MTSNLLPARIGVACLALLMVAASASAATRYDNGLWWDGSEFVAESRHVLDGFFTDDQPDDVAEVIDLEGQYVIPPYAEAHNHNLQNPWLAGRFSEAYVDAGIFYAMMMCGSSQTRDATADALAATPLDVVLVDACITSSDGHPVRMALQPSHEGAPAPEPEDIYDRSLIIMDSVADIEDKWPLITPSDSGVVKIILVHSEDDSRRGDEQFFGVNGLEPEVALKLVPFLQDKGLRVAAHVESAVDFAVAVEAGVDFIAHVPGYRWWDGYDEQSYRLGEEAVARAADQGTYVITTTSVVDLFSGQGAEQRQRVQELQAENLASLRAAGVPVLMGSDRFDANILVEYDYLAELGVFDEQELLNMLTRDTARAIFPGRRIGELSAGHEASFLVLSDNPLQVRSALKTPVLRVVKGGRL